MRYLVISLVLSLTATGLFAEQLGSVDTAFKLLGKNHKIVVEAFDDPDIANATCYLSRAKKGGISGSLGLATDTSALTVCSFIVLNCYVLSNIQKAL